MGVTILYIVVLAIVAYLLGSIPTAVWVGKAFFKIDVREYGSKNAGATNTIRTLGLPAGLAVFAIDLLKGFVATSLYRVLFHLVPTLNGSWPLLPRLHPRLQPAIYFVASGCLCCCCLRLRCVIRLYD